MSLKNDIEMVKEELNSEEKFFERSVITERFVKKYKNAIIGSVVVVVLLIAGNIANDIHKQGQIDDINKAFTLLNNDTKNFEAIATIKQINPDLYDAWIYSQAIAQKDLLSMKELENSKALLIDDLATYELAQDSQDESSLNSYSLKQDSIYKDLALVQSAIIYMNNSDIQKAHEKLKQIAPQSSLSKIAAALLHYGVK